MRRRGRLWLPGLEHTPSPNSDERPSGTEVDLLVIHNISLPPGDFGTTHIQDLFLNRLDRTAHPYFHDIAGLEVSAHVMIRRDGSATQFVALERRAWHAGASSFCGRERCNDYSVGIELVGADDTPFTEPQYRRLAALTAQIRSFFPKIETRRIVGHADIAPGRKTDPGPCFDWEHYRGLLADQPAGQPRTGGT